MSDTTTTTAPAPDTAEFTPATTTAPGPEPAHDDVPLEVEMGALTEMVSPGGVTMWETHRRGKNWMASIGKDPTAPNGLARSFWEKARGEYFYMLPAGLTPGTPVEIGADYYSGSGNPSRRRWYGFVTAVSDTSVTLRRCGTAAAAIAAAERFAPPAPAPEPEPAPDDFAALLRGFTDDQIDAMAKAMKAEKARRRQGVDRA